jgi:GT2 family glycosyltransferase
LQALRSKADVHLFRNKMNTGFSVANMMGVQLADADYYYFLNNDTVLLNDCLSIFYSFLERNSRVANCSGEMFTASREYEHSFRYLPTLSLKLLGTGILRKVWPERFLDKYTRLTRPARVDVVSGSSMFIRATAFEDIGGFDTNYFLYLEEEDIALRLERGGHQTYLIPDAQYQHFVSKSTQVDNKINLPFLKEYYISLLYYYDKNYNRVYRYMFQIYHFIKTVRKFYKNRDYVTLALFIASGAPLKHSLRFKQKIQQE